MPARGSDPPARSRADRARAAASSAGTGCARSRSAADPRASPRHRMFLPSCSRASSEHAPSTLREAIRNRVRRGGGRRRLRSRRRPRGAGRWRPSRRTGTLPGPTSAAGPGSCGRLRVTVSAWTSTAVAAAGSRSASAMQPVGVGRIDRQARHADGQRVAEEDLRERLADDGGDAPAAQPLRRVLARRSAAEVAVDDQDRGAGEARVVERMAAALPRRGGAIVLEDVRLEPLEADRLQEAGRHDPVGVDVLPGDGHDGALEADDAGDRAGRDGHAVIVNRQCKIGPCGPSSSASAALALCLAGSLGVLQAADTPAVTIAVLRGRRHPHPDRHPDREQVDAHLAGAGSRPPTCRSGSTASPSAGGASRAPPPPGTRGRSTAPRPTSPPSGRPGTWRTASRASA